MSKRGMLEFVGFVVDVGKTQTVGKKGNFTKREIVIVDNPDKDYPNTLKFEVNGDKCGLLDFYKKGDKVTLSAYVNGRVWHNPKTDADMFFTTLNIYKIDKFVEGEESAPAEPAEVEPEEAGDDMPF